MRNLLPEEEAVVKPLADYTMFTGESISRDIVAREIHDVDAISTKYPSKMFLDMENLENAKKLKVVNVSTNTFNIGTFVEAGLDVDYATKHGIYITNTPIGSKNVADKTWGLLLAAARRIIDSDRYTRSGEWRESNTYHIRFLVHQVHDKTLGIIQHVMQHYPIVMELLMMVLIKELLMLQNIAILI